MTLRMWTIVAGFVVIACKPVGPVWSQAPASAIKTSKPVVFDVKMTTTFVTPADNQKIDQVRVFHALPTPRSWNQAEKAGAANLKFAPNTATSLRHTETNSQYLLWTVNGRQKPGTKLTFSSTMTISSPDRNLDAKSAKTTWKGYLAPLKDKTAIVDPAAARAVHPELAKVAAEIKTKHAPAEAVQAMCQWIVDTIKYDASVPFSPSDVQSIVAKKCGHCGHQATILRQLTESAGIPLRTVWGMNLYVPDGRTSELQKVRADYTNIHTWAEVYLPGIGWVEVDPALGAKAYTLPASQIQNNRWFQNYSIWIREGGMDKQPTWTPTPGGFKSDYGVEHIISYTQRK